MKQILPMFGADYAEIIVEGALVNTKNGLSELKEVLTNINSLVLLKVARYSFSGSIPPKFEHKLRRHKQSFGKIATTAVLDKDKNLL